MKTLQSRWPGGKHYRPTFTAYTAHCIAVREAQEDERFSGPSHGSGAGGTANRGRVLTPAHGLPLATCIAYTDAGNICGLSPAPFLDLMRGGFVCADHKPERRES